jgi:hypothetical protein
MIKKHVNGFHSMLLVAPDKEKKDESNISWCRWRIKFSSLVY